MKIFFAALILLLTLEGSLFAAFPELMRQCLEEGGRTPAPILRKLGIFCLLLALALGLFLDLNM